MLRSTAINKILARVRCEKRQFVLVVVGVGVRSSLSRFRSAFAAIKMYLSRRHKSEMGARHDKSMSGRFAPAAAVAIENVDTIECKNGIKL